MLLFSLQISKSNHLESHLPLVLSLFKGYIQNSSLLHQE